MQKSKIAVWRGPTNSCEKKRSEKGEKERYKSTTREENFTGIRNVDYGHLDQSDV